MNIPYKYRGIALLALLGVLLPWAVWRYAFHETVAAWLDCRKLSVRIAAAPRHEAVQSAIGVDGPELILSGGLLDIIRQVAEGNSQVIGYEPHVSLEEEGLTLHTAQLTLTGNYHALLRVVEQIERSSCRLRSLSWRSIDCATRQRQLSATLYIEQIVTKK